MSTYPVRIEVYLYGSVEADSPEEAEDRALKLNARLYDASPIPVTLAGEEFHLHAYPDPDDLALEVLYREE